MLTRIIDVADWISPSLKRLIVRMWYQYLTVLDKEALMTFMNFGYSDLNPDAIELALSDGDEVNRYCIQLYHLIAGAIELKGLDVLEVGCGRGGGASYITRYLHPRSMTGVDISENAIAFCNKYHCVEGLSFLQGDAESLPFDDNTFDVIVNVESSQFYGSMERFLREVFRVLRPNGYFLFTDFRSKDKIDVLRKQFISSDLEVLKEESITSNVLKALDCDNKRKLELIHQKVPGIMRKHIQQFAGIQGTKTYEALRTGDADYLSFILYKRGVSEPTKYEKVDQGSALLVARAEVSHS
ncbi:MAG TPA: methyltransferase domain-containing protein [Ktedonobacteraceae bacterium]|nr:methyltransferase domain-containing protein [Ktedonobacteraceae bacterium]